MEHSRRELAALLPALLKAQSPALPSKTWRFEDLPVRQGKTSKARDVFNGRTTRGLAIELHMTEIPAGEAPHDPHRHVHEEILLLLEGTLETVIEGKRSEIGPSCVAYIASNEMHGWRNTGKTPARYYVFTLGREPA